MDVIAVTLSLKRFLQAVAMIWETSKPFSDFVDNYQEIKRSIIDFTETDRTTEDGDYEKKLESLKLHFGKQIHSVRQLDAARDVRALVFLLEKRLLLGWFNVDPLVEVMKTYEMDETNTFGDLMNYRIKLNDFKVCNKQAFTPPPYDPDIFSQVPKNRDVLPPRVYDKICALMDNDWRAFGNEMVCENYATEGQMDELKRDGNLTNEDATRRVLDIFVNGGDKRSKRSQLSKLLRLIHRNDIDEVVESMFLDGNSGSS
uniref:Type III pantothenate kinase n=2 Tax=Lygus hesperus TaxID=30085 RepID=A0A0A9WTI8_LYGHE